MMRVELPSASQVLQSIGSELLIFVLTLFFAFVLQKVSKLSPLAGNKVVCKEARLASKQAPLHVDADEPIQSQPLKPLRSKSTPDTTRQPLKDCGQIMNEVVSLMRNQPNMRNAVKALALYSELREFMKSRRLTDIAHQYRTNPVEFFTVLVQSACRAGRAQLVEGIVDDMVRHGIARPLEFYESAMKQLAGQKQYRMALAIYDRIIGDGLEPSAVTCSCLVSFAAEVGELTRAIQFFEKLASITTPSIRAYMTVLRVHAKRLDWQCSRDTFYDMQKRGVSIDSLVLNVVLATGVATDQVEGAEALLLEAAELRPPVGDLISYNTIIKGYAQRSDGAKALELMATMRGRAFVPNAITFNTTMDACVRGMKSTMAWELLGVMRESGLKPDKFTCSILTKGLAKGSTPDQIYACLDLLQEVGDSCEPVLRSTLLHSVLDAAATLPSFEPLTETFSQMWKHSVVPSANAFRHMIHALGEVEAFELVEQLQSVRPLDISIHNAALVGCASSRLQDRSQSKVPAQKAARLGSRTPAE
mmetsp:Transcript_47259/g.86780  ORF Transcript_47259/g.86780 Transcript_47259/m.86780 type:complete len:532 (-) Transcript_47259:41-1636(-)